MRLKRKRSFTPSVDALEGRQMLSGSATPFGLTPAQIDNAYDITRLNFGKTRGYGQEIAIVVVGNNPNIWADLTAFDAQYGLINPILSVYQVGTVPTDVAGDGNGFETDLDIQQAHQVAPAAKIDLIEVGPSYPGVLAGMQWAANNTNASAISASYGFYGTETRSNDQITDSYLAQPSGHHVVFVLPAGDNGPLSNTSNGVYSGNVLAVGGTSLFLNGSGGYGSENAWLQSGGSVSQYEPQPGFQSGVVSALSTTNRVTPDVSWDAGNAVSVYDSFDFGSSTPWNAAVGTSVGAPSWAGVTAILDEGLNVLGVPSYTTSQLESFLYGWNGTAAFHKINGISGSYGVLSGLGSPDVNQLSLYSTINVGYSESYYLENNPDVAAAVANGAFASGYQQLMQRGLYEGRIGTPDWYDPAYLGQNPDVANALRNGAFVSGYEDYMQYGRNQGRSDGLFFNEISYQQRNSDVVTAIQAGYFSSGFNHFYQYGQVEDDVSTFRDPSSQFDGVAYLAAYPDVAAAVRSGSFKSAWQHFVVYGYVDGYNGLG